MSVHMVVSSPQPKRFAPNGHRSDPRAKPPRTRKEWIHAGTFGLLRVAPDHFSPIVPNHASYPPNSPNSLCLVRRIGAGVGRHFDFNNRLAWISELAHHLEHYLFVARPCTPGRPRSKTINPYFF